MKRAKVDAMEKVRQFVYPHPWTEQQKRERAEFLRAVRALLVERAEAAAVVFDMMVGGEHSTFDAVARVQVREHIRAAVLKSPGRSTSPARAGKRG